DRFQFLSKIRVLSREPRLLSFQKHPFGDVNEHGARIVAFTRGSRPPLDPDWAAVVLAAQFDDDSLTIRSRGEKPQSLFQAPLRGGIVRHQWGPGDARDLRRCGAAGAARTTLG